jgi:predicted TIM-barrel fold metal-dependent hydrolase
MIEPQSTARRRFLQHVGAAAIASGAATVHGDADNRRLLVIDCHAHIYGEDELRYPTVAKPYRPPAGTGSIKNLRKQMQAAGVRHVTAIQTSSFYKWDNRFTADSARANRDWMAGVVTLDPDDARSPRQLERFVRDSNVRGMRSVPAKSGRLDDPGVAQLWKTAERLGVVINVLVDRDQRRDVESLAVRHPKLRVVLDHCMNLKAGPQLESTLADVTGLARLPNLHAKLTFIPTGSAEPFPCRDMHAACHQVIAAYGPERCVWGSDFPCELWCPRVSYAQHLRIFTHELQLGRQAKAAILGETAKGLWF